MVRFFVPAPPGAREELADALFAAGAGGLEELPDGLCCYTDDPALLERFRDAVQRIVTRLPGVGAPSESRVNSDWQRTWQRALQPVPLVDDLVFRPTHAAPAPEGERTLWYEPKTSFGDGAHPTTRLACRALQKLATQRPGASLLDVGCGTGVLSLCALRLGFHRAIGVDVEPESIESAQLNARLNGLQERFDVIAGSADAAQGTFGVVVANINTPILLQVAGATRTKLAPGGHLVLTGLLNEDQDEVIAAYETDGLQLLDTLNDEDWMLLCFVRSKGGDEH